MKATFPPLSVVSLTNKSTAVLSYELRTFTLDISLRRRRCSPKHSFILGVEKNTYFGMIIDLTQQPVCRQASTKNEHER